MKNDTNEIVRNIVPETETETEIEPKKYEKQIHEVNKHDWIVKYIP